MTDLVGLVEAMPANEQAIAAKVLDACSRPLSVREIERMLRKNGCSRTQAEKLASTLRRWSIIAVVGPEE